MEVSRRRFNFIRIRETLYRRALIHLSTFTPLKILPLLHYRFSPKILLNNMSGLLFPVKSFYRIPYQMWYLYTTRVRRHPHTSTLPHRSKRIVPPIPRS
jgi:hypothetical protein